MGIPRLGYDGDESLYFDRTKWVSDPDMVDDEGQPLNLECDPVEVCAEIEAERDASLEQIAKLEKDRDRLDKLHRLLKAGATVYVNGDNETSIYLMDSIVGVEGPSYWHLREAIDAVVDEPT